MGLKASRNLFPRFRLEFCNTSLADFIIMLFVVVKCDKKSGRNNELDELVMKKQNMIHSFDELLQGEITVLQLNYCTVVLPLSLKNVPT